MLDRAMATLDSTAVYRLVEYNAEQYWVQYRTIPEIRFEMFDTMIKPILTYSSDVWGINKNTLCE